MIQSKTNNIYLRISLLSFVVYIFAPVTRILPTGLKAAFIAVALFFLLLHIVSENKKILLNTITFTIGIVIIDFLIYYGIWRTNEAVTVVNKSLMIFVFWMPFFYIQPVTFSTEKTKIFLQKLLEFLIIVELTTTFVGNIIFPMASRLLASPLEVEQNRIFQAANIGGYGFIYAIVMALPIFIYKYKCKPSLKHLIIITLSIVTILMSFYMTAIILTIFVLFLCLSITSKKGRLWGGVILIAIYFLSNTILNSLMTLSMSELLSDNPIISERLINIHEFITEGSFSGDLGYREELRNSSWNSFIQSPLYGNLVGSFNTLGLHSEYIDWLGGTGLLGVCFIMLVLRRRLIQYFSIVKKSPIVRYVYISFLGILIFGFMNVLTSAPEISTITLLLSLAYLNSNSESNMKTFISKEEL